MWLPLRHIRPKTFYSYQQGACLERRLLGADLTVYFSPCQNQMFLPRRTNQRFFGNPIKLFQGTGKFKGLCYVRRNCTPGSSLIFFQFRGLVIGGNKSRIIRRLIFIYIKQIKHFFGFFPPNMIFFIYLVDKNDLKFFFSRAQLEHLILKTLGRMFISPTAHISLIKPINNLFPPNLLSIPQ